MWKYYTMIKISTITLKQRKHIHTHVYTRTAFPNVILSRNTLSFDPIGVFFWPTYLVDPSGFGLFALVRCIQWHTPLMCKYRLYWYKAHSWPIAYWFKEAVWSLCSPCLWVDKTCFAISLQKKLQAQRCIWNITVVKLRLSELRLQLSKNFTTDARKATRVKRFCYWLRQAAR